MRVRVAVWCLPALLFLALHGRALGYDFVWVDRAEIVAGSILRPPGHILAAFGEPLQRAEGFATAVLSQPYYRPLQVVTASALAEAAGRSPRAFHALSLALGAATAALFGLLALAWLRDPAAALLAGLLFAAHPGLLEIYVWVAGLSAALMGLFLIVSLDTGLRSVRAASARARWSWGVASLAALALGLLSKENAAVTPALLAALGRALWLRARGETRPRVPALATLVATELALVGIYLFALRPAVLGRSLTGAAPIGGSLLTQWQSSLAQWPSQMLWLFAPLHSNTSDAVRVVTSWGDPAVLAGLALALGSAALGAALAWRGHALAAAALAWIWIGFLPTSGLAPLLQARAERNLFLSIFGAALLVAVALTALARTRAPRAAVVALGLFAVLALSQRTWARLPDWRSTEALFSRDVANDPRHREGRVNWIVALAESGRLAEAKQQVDVLAAQRPDEEGWHSYLLDSNLRELVCLVNAQAGADADTLRRYPPHPLGRAEVWSEPGFHACYAAALERMSRCEDALPIYATLARGSRGADAQRFAEGVARCKAAGTSRPPRSEASRPARSEAQPSGDRTRLPSEGR